MPKIEFKTSYKLILDALIVISFVSINKNNHRENEIDHTPGRKITILICMNRNVIQEKK